jgi:hypothetical protein
MTAVIRQVFGVERDEWTLTVRRSRGKLACFQSDAPENGLAPVAGHFEPTENDPAGLDIAVRRHLDFLTPQRGKLQWIDVSLL